MERLYDRARRLDRVGDQVHARRAIVEQRLVELRSTLTALETAPVDALLAFEARLPPVPRSSVAHNVPWATWVGPRGERVWVGRNESGNRRLTFQVARAHDFWMHLRGQAAAHIVIPMERDHTPSLGLLLAAAQIALAHAKVPEGTAAEVQYTRRRNVRSVPGGGATVQLHDEKVLRVVRDRAALAEWTRED
jgi:hypothetical protein